MQAALQHLPSMRPIAWRAKQVAFCGAPNSFQIFTFNLVSARFQYLPQFVARCAESCTINLRDVALRA